MKMIAKTFIWHVKDIMNLISHNDEKPERNWSVCDDKYITKPNKKNPTLKMSKKEITNLQVTYHFCTTILHFGFLLFGFDHLR